MAIHLVKNVGLYWQSGIDAPADAGFLHTISNEASIALTADSLDVTTMGTEWRDFLSGLKQAQVSVSGFIPSGDDYPRTVSEMWSGWQAERWIVIEPSGRHATGHLNEFAARTRSVALETGMQVGEAETFALSINAHQNFWRAHRLFEAAARPTAALNQQVGMNVLGADAARVTEVYLIFVLRGPNMGSGKSLTATWNTDTVTTINNIFRPTNSTTERMTVVKAGVKTTGNMRLQIAANQFTNNFAATNGLNIYVVPIR